MPSRHRTLASALVALLLATPAFAQNAPPAERVIRMNGAAPDAAGKQTTIRFAIYDAEAGGTLLWQESQAVAVDQAGQYTAFLGAMSADGLPLNLFANGAPRWLAVEGPGGALGPRTLLAAVPYAVAAATATNATTLAGRPASDFQLTPAARKKDATGGLDATASGDLDVPAVNNGTANYIGKFFNNVDLINSSLYDAGGLVGLNTTSPLDIFHSRFTNAGGTQTGLAVQNLSSAANAYSGMLFYDHTGALRQFQGYNNSTQEYRINNIGANGTINFMIEGSSMFRILNNGDIGLSAGTFSPDVKLHMFSNAIDGVTVRGSRHGGTIAAPTAVPSGQSLMRIEASGYNGSSFTTDRGLIRFASTEAWTTTANGTALEFYTTPNGSTIPSRRLYLTNNGQFGVNATPGSWEVNNTIQFTADFGPATGDTFAIQNVKGTGAAYLNLNGGDFAGVWLSRADANKWRILNNDTTDTFSINSTGGTTRLSITQAGVITLGGNTTINGTFTATGAKSFTIDHPLDPGKTLSHAAIESPEVLNLYRGNITTDATGKAVVQLPEYFEAINVDPSYHLTVVGQFAQAIVSREVSANTFEISTSVPNVKVSWEIKAVRNDLYMREHPYEVEKIKPTTEDAGLAATGAARKR